MKPGSEACRYTSLVAPLAGAWIETRAGNYQSAPATSPPSRVRGLKPVACGSRMLPPRAPLAGAWIAEFLKKKFGRPRVVRL